VLFTHFNDYKVRLIGSATGLDYRGTKFLVCTAHQLKDVSGEDVGIIVPVKNYYISSAGYTRFRAPDAPAGKRCRGPGAHGSKTANGISGARL
jgi:hypothetical protein